jgi:hypothetical protein
MGKDKRHSRKKPATESPAAGNLPEQTVEEVHVIYQDAPPSPPRGKRIHPRQVIPPVPEGEHRPDETPSPPVELD